MDNRYRCGKCTNCQELERVSRRVLAACNPPFSHATDDVIDLWNTELARLPCTGPANPIPHWPYKTNHLVHSEDSGGGYLVRCRAGGRFGFGCPICDSCGMGPYAYPDDRGEGGIE